MLKRLMFGLAQLSAIVLLLGFTVGVVYNVAITQVETDRVYGGLRIDTHLRQIGFSSLPNVELFMEGSEIRVGYKKYMAATIGGASEWITIGSSFIIEEEMAGTVDGSNTVFTTQYNFDPNTIEVFFYDRTESYHLKLRRGEDYAVTDTNEITFNQAPIRYDPYTGEEIETTIFANYERN